MGFRYPYKNVININRANKQYQLRIRKYTSHAIMVLKKSSKKRFTLKIAISYLLLVALGLIAGFFIYSEIKGFLSDDSTDKTAEKLLKTGALVTQLYQAESLSKLALQSGIQTNFDAYSLKIDSLVLEIDTLKQLSTSDNQISLLDSVQVLLNQKVANSNELRNLFAKTETNTAIDKALREFGKMESATGKLTIHTFEPNPEKLSPYKRKVLEDWVAYLNQNIPEETTAPADSKKIDSILNASRALLSQVKRNDAKAQLSLSTKEKEINENDLQLSYKLRTIISAIEQEIIVKGYNQALERKAVLRRSMRLAGGAAILGFLVVGLFTFLINRDFWRIQSYRQQLEEEKKFSESLLKSREQLISTVSHDLKTPLSTITGYTELMEGTPLTDKQKHYLKSVKSSSGYVENLVNDLLDFSKLEAGKLHVENIPFVCSNLIQETAENLHELNKHKNVKLYLEIDEALQTPVLGDPFRLKQLLTNLIGNAFKFTEKGFVRIEAKATKKGALLNTEIYIQDTGIGIPKEKQRIIFKEFAQADDTTEKKFGGYGLGLTISKKIAKLLNGNLKVQSKLGTGSVFSLQLPFQITSLSIQLEDDNQYLIKKLRILIIDDDTALLKMLKELMETMGITAYTYPNFLRVEKQTHLDYDLVLTDIQMPQITGFEVLKRLKSGAYKHYQQQPIVAMTGRRDLDMESYTEVGFDQVLQKPFSKKELLAILRLLGLTDKIASKEKVVKEDIIDSNEIYNLDLIESFLGDNTEAINDVLKVFVDDTLKNKEELKAAVEQRDFTNINQIAHRMLPMFRQLKVSAVPILERWEIGTPETIMNDNLDNDFDKLNSTSSKLISALKKRFITSPTYND